jgi:arsenical pump membrane protein
MNNMPTDLVAVLAIDATVAHGVVHEATVYANVMGADLAPKLTLLGSLAKLLWLHVLSAQGIKISWGYCFPVWGIIDSADFTRHLVCACSSLKLMNAYLR